MAEQDFDRSEQATPFKLERAREQGQVAKSPDFVGAVVFVAAAVWAAALGVGAIQGLLGLFHRAWLAVWRSAGSDGQMTVLPETFLLESAQLLLPFLVSLLVIGVVANVIQTGPVLALKAIAPDWGRINPAQGLQRIFSMRTLVDAFKAILKLSLLVLVVWFALAALLPQFRQLATLLPWELMRLVVADVASLTLKIGAALAVVGLIDLVYSRREFGKKMRMSRRELKDEVKQREGDPRIRARMKQLRQEMLKRVQSVSRTQEAAVVVTNPSHVAVALRYERGAMQAPVLVAKGVGSMAASIRAMAAKHRIPVVRSPLMARALYAEVPIDGQIPVHWYSAVARVMIWLHATKQGSRPQNSGSARASGQSIRGRA